MSADSHWNRIHQLFDSLVTIPAGEWTDRLSALEQDPDLRAEVFALLKASQAERQANERALPPMPEFIGPYRIIALAGSGGRGRVYQAVRTVAGAEQMVAIKTMLDHLITPADLSRFEREQRLLLSLQHPSIARFLAAGWDANQRPYLVMDWVDGKSIDEYVQSHKAPRDASIRLILDLLDALQHAHRALIVHLDLKPSNIKVTADAKAVILDFGTAKLLSDTRETSTQQLTPRYASPEQLRGEPVTTACDLYSTGLILHELITGRFPFPHADGIAALGDRATGAAIPAIATGNPDLDAIIHKALQHDPLQRYATASAFSADLHAFLDGRPVTARRPTLAYRAARLFARHRAVCVLSLLVLLAIAALSAYALHQQQLRAREAARARDTARFLSGMIASSTINASGRNGLTVAEMIEQSNQNIQAGSFLPPGTAALLQANFANFFLDQGREQLAETIAHDAIARADQSGETLPRVAARTSLATLLLRRNACPQVVQLIDEAAAIIRTTNEPPPPGRYLDWRFAQAETLRRCHNDLPASISALEQIARESDQMPDDAFQIAAPVYRAGLRINLALQLGTAGRSADALRTASEGLLIAGKHPSAAYVRVALLRIRSNIHTLSGNPAAGLADIREAIRIAPGVVNPFESARLQSILALRLIDTGDTAAAEQTAGAVVRQAREQRTEIGPSYWMLLAEAAEIHARIRSCAASADLYREADAARPGATPMPRDWLGNRRFREAECALPANPALAARLAQQAMETYGAMLPANSKRRTRLQQIIGAASKR